MIVRRPTESQISDSITRRCVEFVIARHLPELRLLEDDCRTIGADRAALLAVQLIEELEKQADADFSTEPLGMTQLLQAVRP